MANNEKVGKTRVNYGYLLSCKEKDNPSPFCRASYLMSNVGDLIKCYGRALRFPADKKLYMTEAMLAIGDVLMQCRLIEYGFNIPRNEQSFYDNIQSPTTNTALSSLAYNTAVILDILTMGTEEDNIDELELGENINVIIWSCQGLCETNEWNIEDVEHLGFLHVMERFEEFERRGWE